MSFALLMAQTNASVLDMLANVQVQIGDATVPGIFRNPSSVANLGHGAADTSPTVVVASSVVPTDAADQLIHIDGVPYAIVNPAPDGTGLSTLTVECVQ
jgi:hypothetical protein